MSGTFERKAPAISDFSPLTMPQPLIKHFDNGVTLHLIEAPGYGISSINLAWRSAVAEATYDGLPSYTPFLVADLLREGSQKYPGATIADVVDFEGASLSARSDTHYTIVNLTALPKSLPELLPIIGDMAQNPTFENDAFEAIRTKAAQKADIDNTKPSVVADHCFTDMISGKNHPYLPSPTGDDIRAITRQQVIACHRKGFDSAPIHLFYCGPLDNGIGDMLMAFAQNLRSAPSDPARDYFAPFVAEPPATKIVKHNDPNQIAISMGMPTITREHPDYIPLRTAIMALGGHFGSRLNSNIRERLGLTYGISAALYGQREGAFMSVQAQCRRGTAQRVIDEIKGEIERLATEPLNDEEFSALHSIVSSSLVANVDSPIAVMRHHVSALLSVLPATYYDDQWRSWQSLTPAIIADMASRYLNPDNLRIAYTD